MTEYEDIRYPPESWSPRPYQMPIWLDLNKSIPNIHVIGHRQMGKDELFMNGNTLEAVRYPGSYVYCLPKKTEVRENMWEAVNPQTGVSRIDEAFPPDLRTKKLDVPMSIELPVMGDDTKHSRVSFTGSDNSASLRGAVARCYTFSEWAFCDPNALGVVRPIVTANNGLLRFVSSPCGQNHAYKMLVENGTKADWRCYLVTNNTRHVLADDKHAKGIIHIQSHRISEAKMKEILEENIQLYGPEIGKSLTDQEYECSFEEIVPGSFYLDLLLKAEREQRIRDIAPRPDLPVHAFFDLGFSDPTAIWYVQMKEDGWLDIVGYDEFTITSAPEVVIELRKRPWYYGGLYLPHDGAHHHFDSGTTVEKIFTAAGFTVSVMPQTDDASQIPSVRTILPRCRFRDLPEVKRGLDCLRHFHNKPKTEGGKTSWSPKPVHDWSSHGSKAFATLAYFAPDLRAGVEPPRPAVKDPFAPSGPTSSGWMR